MFGRNGRRVRELTAELLKVTGDLAETRAALDKARGDAAGLAGDKFSAVREGSFFRLTALRSFGEVVAGQRGGLVKSPFSLSHQGGCWVDEQSTVWRDTTRIRGDAQVTNSTLDGWCVLSGDATVHNSTVRSLHACGTTTVVRSTLAGTSNLRDVLVDESTVQCASLHKLGGHVTRSSVKLDPNFHVTLFGDLHEADVTVPEHLLQIVTGWGPMMMFRGNDGSPVFAVGCQERRSLDGVKELAAQYSGTGFETRLVDQFAALAQAQLDLWPK